MQSLYNLSQEYLRAYDKMISDKDLPKEAINDTLEGLSGEMEDKILNVGKMLKNINAFINALQDEESKLNDRRKSLEKNQEDMSEFIIKNMALLNIKHIYNAECDLKTKSCKPKLIIKPGANIPVEYKYMKAILTLDKTSMRNALKKGEKIEGAYLLKKNTLTIE